MQSKFAESAELANQALQLAEPLAHLDIRLVSAVRTMSYNTLGILSQIQRDIPSALTYWRNAEDAALLAGNLRTAFRIKGNIGGLLFDQGDLNESRQTYEGIVDAVQAMGDIFTLARILNALGAIYHLQARPAEALEILERARKIKRLIGDQQGEAATDNQYAQGLLISGRAQEALLIMERLLKQTEGSSDMRWRASYLDTMGMIQLALGEFEGARERIEEAMSLPGAVSDPQLKTYLRNHLTLAYLGAGNLTKAQEIFHVTEGVLSTGMAAVESILVEALLFAACGDMNKSYQRLDAMQKAADRLSIYLYAQIAVLLKAKMQSGLPIPQCVQFSMGAQGFPDEG
jgi:tetratricopeptide (TPR) repeat protein